MSGIDIASNSALLSVADKLDMQNIFLAAIAGKDNGLPINDWGSVQAIVRAGLAPKVFAVGDQFTVFKGDEQLVFDVIGIDHDIPVDPNCKHSLTLQMHDCYINMQYDAPEALYYCEEELIAGDYYFTIHNYDVDFGGNSSYSFNLSKNVPAGGQICFNWNYNVHASLCTVSTYENQVSTNQIETVGVTAGENGTFLGITDGTSKNMNHIMRARFGSNNWETSPIRQWLNADAASDKWWVPSNIYDRPFPDRTLPGFLNDIDKEFVSVLGKVHKQTVLNQAVDGGTYYDSQELIFIVSQSEVFGKTENKGNGGTPYDYYRIYSELASSGNEEDGNRIKHLNRVQKHWWLRSPQYYSSTNVCNVNANGAIFSNIAVSNFGVIPTCCII